MTAPRVVTAVSQLRSRRGSLGSARTSPVLREDRLRFDALEHLDLMPGGGVSVLEKKSRTRRSSSISGSRPSVIPTATTDDVASPSKSALWHPAGQNFNASLGGAGCNAPAALVEM